MTLFGKNCFSGVKHRVRFQQHPLSTAEWAIVDAAVPVESPLPEVMDLDVHDTRFTGLRHDAVTKRAVKEIGKDREDMELHGERGLVPV
jgi:hypothetical protein